MEPRTHRTNLNILLNQGGIKRNWVGTPLTFVIQSDEVGRQVALGSLPIEIISLRAWSLTDEGFLVLPPQTLHPDHIDDELLFDSGKGLWRMACWTSPDAMPEVYYGTIIQAGGEH